jgi:hypothetical protein
VQPTGFPNGVEVSRYSIECCSQPPQCGNRRFFTGNSVVESRLKLFKNDFYSLETIHIFGMQQRE